MHYANEGIANGFYITCPQLAVAADTAAYVASFFIVLSF
jgi:hypothetical protein